MLFPIDDQVALTLPGPQRKIPFRKLAIAEIESDAVIESGAVIETEAENWLVQVTYGGGFAL